MGLDSEDDLLGFLRGLEGIWGSRRKKKKIVDAGDFGDFLPIGWKLLLSVRRKDGRFSLFCSKIPGTFNFSVLDSGVISNEYWTIVDVAVDFSWGLFHYSGAARAAGQSYTGVVLVSPGGEYPKEKEKAKLVSALEKCGIKEWELFMVDNCSCENPPLGIPDGSSLHRKIEVKALK